MTVEQFNEANQVASLITSLSGIERNIDHAVRSTLRLDDQNYTPLDRQWKQELSTQLKQLVLQAVEARKSELEAKFHAI